MGRGTFTVCRQKHLHLLQPTAENEQDRSFVNLQLSTPLLFCMTEISHRRPRRRRHARRITAPGSRRRKESWSGTHRHPGCPHLTGRCPTDTLLADAHVRTHVPLRKEKRHQQPRLEAACTLDPPPRPNNKPG